MTADSQVNLWSLFRAVAAAVPDREAIVWRDVRRRYAELVDRSARLATVLAEHGLGTRRGRTVLQPWDCGQDLVGLALYNGPEYLEAMLAGYCARVAPFNLNYRYVPRELAYVLRDADAKGLIFHGRVAPVVADALQGIDPPVLLLQVADDSGAALLPGAIDYETAITAAAPRTAADQSPDDLYVLYTGGTTGMPKGTLWRQHDIWQASLGGASHGDKPAAEIVAEVASSDEQRMFLVAPLMHGGAQWGGLTALLAGATVVLGGVVEHLDPVDVWTTIERERAQITFFIGDAVCRPLLDELQTGRYDASSLATIVVGGAFTSTEVKKRLLELIPTATIVDGAGSSESGTILRSTSTKGAIAPRAVFELQEGASVLNDALDRELAEGEDAVGWLAMSGPLPLGFLGDEAKSTATFRQVGGRRWCVPGDRARRLTGGRAELLGRESITINTGGEKVFAEEVEDAILAHPAVLDVVVVGRPDSRWGQAVVAIVQLVEGATATDEGIVACAARSVARYKLPKSILRVPRVERSPAGKADYAWARAVAERG